VSRDLTRRAAVAAIAAGAPTLATAAPSQPDAQLIELGQQFDEITVALTRRLLAGYDLRSDPPAGGLPAAPPAEASTAP
jgi:hypothetical protein